MWNCLCVDLKKPKGFKTSDIRDVVHKASRARLEWIYSSENAIMGHERLAIVDQFGKQPLYSPNKKIILAANGEIYNHLELRAIKK